MWATAAPACAASTAAAATCSGVTGTRSLRAVVSPTPVTAQVMKTSQFMVEHLFSPLEIGPATLANRIVSTAHQTNHVHDNLPTDDFVAYHEERARGGTGLIVPEAT